MKILKMIRSSHNVRSFYHMTTHYEYQRMSLDGIVGKLINGFYCDTKHPFYKAILADDGYGIPTKERRVSLNEIKSRLIKYLKHNAFMSHKPRYLSVKKIPQSTIDYEHDIVCRRSALDSYINHMSPNQFRYFQHRYPKIKEIRPSKVCDNCLDLIMPSKPNYMLGTNMSDTQPYNIDWVDPDDHTYLRSVCDGSSIDDVLNNFIQYLSNDMYFDDHIE